MVEVKAIYSMFGSEQEALSVARILLEKKLVACVNVYNGATSLYRWKGEINSASEVLFIAKTTAEKLKNAMDEVKRLHSYEVPCIIACPIEAGFPPYIQWIKDEVA
ncbi:MAG: divalent-cation tolerance protein CutA [Alphaproteobacteria bacterium]